MEPTLADKLRQKSSNHFDERIISHFFFSFEVSATNFHLSILKFFRLLNNVCSSLDRFSVFRRKIKSFLVSFFFFFLANGKFILCAHIFGN